MEVKTCKQFWSSSTFSYDLLDEVLRSIKQGQQGMSCLLYTSRPSIEDFYRHSSSLDSEIKMLKSFHSTALHWDQVLKQRSGRSFDSIKPCKRVCVSATLHVFTVDSTID